MLNSPSLQENEWNPRKEERYNELYTRLMSPDNRAISRDEIGRERARSGVYVFYHERRPEAWPHSLESSTARGDAGLATGSEEPAKDKKALQAQDILSIVGIFAVVLVVLALVLLPVIKKGISWKPSRDWQQW